MFKGIIKRITIWLTLSAFIICTLPSAAIFAANDVLLQADSSSETVFNATGGETTLLTNKTYNFDDASKTNISYKNLPWNTELRFDDGVYCGDTGYSIWINAWASYCRMYLTGVFSDMDIDTNSKVKVSYKAKMSDDCQYTETGTMGVGLIDSSKNEIIYQPADERTTVKKGEWVTVSYEFSIDETIPDGISIIPDPDSSATRFIANIDDIEIEISEDTTDTPGDEDGETTLLTYKKRDFNDGINDGVSYKHLTWNTELKIDGDVYYGDSGYSFWIKTWASYCRMYLTGVFSDMDIDTNSKVKVSYKAKMSDDCQYTETGTMGVGLIDSSKNEIIYQPADERTTVKKGEWVTVSYEFSIDETIPDGISIIPDPDSSATRFIANIDDIEIEISEDTTATPPDEGDGEGETTPPEEPSNDIILTKTFDFNDGSRSNVSVKNLTWNNDIKPVNDVYFGDSGYSYWMSFWARYCRMYLTGAFLGMNIKKGTEVRVSYLAKIADESEFEIGEMGVGLIDGSKNELMYQPAEARTTVKKGEWVTVSYEFSIDETIPDGISIIPDSDASATRFIVNIDNVTIEKIVDETNVIKAEKKNEKINFSGVLEEESASLPLVLYVIKEGYEANDFSNEAVFAKFDVTADANASYTYEALAFDTENYKTNFTLTLDGVKGYKNSYVTKAYVYENDNFIKNLLIGLSNATGADFIKTTLENSENKEILKLSDIEILNDAKFTEKDALYAYLLNNKANIYDEQNPYSTDNLTALIKSGAVLSELGKESVSHLAAYIDKYASGLGIDGLTAYKTTYKNANNKEALVSYLKGDYESASDFADTFEEKIINGAIKEAGVYTDIIKIAEDNKTYLGLDFSSLNSLYSSKKTSAQKDFANYLKSATSYDNLQTQLNSIVATYSQSGGGSSSGGGGGSSSGGGSTKAYAVPAPSDVSNLGTSTLSDISGHWGKEYIDKLIQNGAVSGYVDNTFRPDNTVTRAEFAKMLYFVMGIKDTSKNSSFEDVPNDDWSYPYVSYLYENGVIMGMSNALFGKNNPITRQDMAVIIARILDKEYTKKDADFADADLISDYAIASVDKVFALGIMTGDGQNFNPLGLATRAEAAKVLCSLIS